MAVNRNAGAKWVDASAGWVDTTLPDLSDLLESHSELDASEFVEWLGRKVGFYRASVKAAAAMPNAVDERAHMGRIEAAARELREAISWRNMPPACDERMFLAARALGADWAAFRKDMSNHIRTLRLFASSATVALVDLRTKTGRPSAVARDDLLAAVVKRLRDAPMKADPARHLAQQILQRCGVPVPASPAVDKTDSVRRAVRKSGQKRA